MKIKKTGKKVNIKISKYVLDIINSGGIEFSSLAHTKICMYKNFEGLYRMEIDNSKLYDVLYSNGYFEFIMHKSYLCQILNKDTIGLLISKMFTYTSGNCVPEDVKKDVLDGIDVLVEVEFEVVYLEGKNDNK